jgi:uncharacterized membrane protein YbhN (UPF0104 family)
MTSRRKLLIRIAVSIALLAILFRIIPWTEVRAQATRLPFTTWLAIFGLFLLGHQLGVVKWRSLVNACGAQVRFLVATRAYFAGLFTNLYLPSIVGGDVLRGAIIGRDSGRPEAAFLGGLADRLIDIATMGVLVGGGLLASRSALPGAGAEAVMALVITGALGAGLFLPLAVKLPLSRWPRRLRRRIGRALVSLRRLGRNPGSAALAFAISLTTQGLFVLLNAWIGRELGIDAPLGAWFVAWPLAKLVALLPVSIGGLVVREAALAGVLAQYGVPAATSAVAGLLWQTVNFSGGLAGGVVWWTLGLRGAASQPGARRGGSRIGANPSASNRYA